MGLFIKVVPQATTYVVERFGIYNRTLKTGMHFVWPIIEKLSSAVSLKEKTLDMDPQPVITKDNVTMKVNAIVFYQITDAKLYTYGVENIINAFENLTLTTLRNTIGELELDETLSSRDKINSKMRVVLDEATDPWGIKVNRVELQQILPPPEIQKAMEQQMKAEREKRATILEAEGKKTAQILEAQAEKEAAILKADAERETIVRGGEAEAEAIRLINEAKPSEAYLMLKKLEALQKMADGQATKLVIPTELQSVVSLVNTAKEVK